MARKIPFIVCCCVCRRVRSKAGNWYSRRNLPATATISHTYCPKCAEIAKKNITRYINVHHLY